MWHQVYSWRPSSKQHHNNILYAIPRGRYCWLGAIRMATFLLGSAKSTVHCSSWRIMVDNIFTNLFGPIHKYLRSLGLLYHVNGMLISCVVLSNTFIYPLTHIRLTSIGYYKLLQFTTLMLQQSMDRRSWVWSWVTIYVHINRHGRVGESEAEISSNRYRQICRYETQNQALRDNLASHRWCGWIIGTEWTVHG